MPTKLSKAQLLSTLKVAAYLSVSASLDALISFTTGNQFGVLTPVINLVLVIIRQAFTPAK